MGFLLPLVSAMFFAPRAASADSTCRIENVSPIAFGGYTSGSPTHLDSVGELEVRCSGPVRIHMGRGTSGRLSPREMRGVSGSLSYGLFLDAARTSEWGDGSEGTSPFVGMLTSGQVMRIPVFGRVFGRQAVPAGRYIDQITVTIIF